MANLGPKSGNYCFGCGLDNPVGLKLSFVFDAVTRSVTSHCFAPEYFRGAKGMLHGGMVAVLLDEASSKVLAGLGVNAVTLHISVDYEYPVPTESDLTIKAQLKSENGNRYRIQAEILREDGRVLSSAESIFVAVSAGFAATLGEDE